MEKNKKCMPTSIGGQAVIEGVMMQGPQKRATAVRKSNGEIVIKETPNNSFIAKYKLNKIPILRGFLAFFESMFTGVSCLMFSAKECDIEDEEPLSPFEQKIMDKFGDKLFDVIMYISVAFSLVLGVGLFMVLPKLLIEWVSMPFGKPLNEGVSTLIEGLVRMTIFFCYIILISKMKDIQRVFEYHGAEHKTIFTYEYGEELTVENVKKQIRFHPRCGTSFLVLVMLVSVVVFFIIGAFTGPTTSILEKILWRIVMLPVVAGISYELIKLAGRKTNRLTKIISAPGVWLQHFTTREPDDSQIEVAIAAFKAVMPENKEESKW